MLMPFKKMPDHPPLILIVHLEPSALVSLKLIYNMVRNDKHNRVTDTVIRSRKPHSLESQSRSSTKHEFDPSATRVNPLLRANYYINDPFIIYLLVKINK